MHPDMLLKAAVFSPDRVYRYTLRRHWDDLFADNSKMVAFIGLNPSTADEVKNDPTVTRCVNYAKRWGYAGMFMLNIFAFRSTNPDALYRQMDPIGPWNDEYILQVVEAVDKVVACWGIHGAFCGRGWNVLTMLERAGIRPYRMGEMTQLGQPRHPLYLKKDLEPVQL